MIRSWPVLLIAAHSACNNAASTAHPSAAPAESVPQPVTDPPPVADPPANTSPPGNAQCSGPAPGPDYQCIQDCGPPVASAGDPQPGWRWASAADAKNRKQFGCPICLPDDALIATPNGEVPISKLTAGRLIWSSEHGRHVERRVEHVISVQAPPQHRIVVIELEDGRRLRASPGHPDAGGHPIGKLAVGDFLDGSPVRSMTKVPYSRRTFDLVLESGSVHYFADGVRVRSSLGASQSFISPH